MWRTYRDNPFFTLGDSIRSVAKDAGIKENVCSARFYGWRKRLADYQGKVPEKRNLLQRPRFAGDYERALDDVIEKLQVLRPLLREADRITAKNGK